MQFQVRNFILNLCWGILHDKSPLHHISKSNNCHGVLSDLGTILTHSEAKSRVAQNKQCSWWIQGLKEAACADQLSVVASLSPRNLAVSVWKQDLIGQAFQTSLQDIQTFREFRDGPRRQVANGCIWDE